MQTSVKDKLGNVQGKSREGREPGGVMLSIKRSGLVFPFSLGGGGFLLAMVFLGSKI